MVVDSLDRERLWSLDIGLSHKENRGCSFAYY